MPIHLPPYYRDASTCLPVAEKVWRELLTLMYPGMTALEIDRVITAIMDFDPED